MSIYRKECTRALIECLEIKVELLRIREDHFHPSHFEYNLVKPKFRPVLFLILKTITEGSHSVRQSKCLEI